ncbi:MAG: ABC transporter permease [Spirochaetaceae bacterium]|jgi:peptide/nickel transport system permease protein|nr:ABC transporter permease [Spirochaetaceae bacterium]
MNINANDIVTRLVKEKPLGTVGAVILLVLLLTGIFADVIAPYGYNDVNFAVRLKAPGSEHIMGTDNLGRDIFSRIVYGVRFSMIVGFGVSLLGTVISVLLGSISGYFGGFIDTLIQRFVDAMMCLPSLVVLLTVIAITGPGLVPLTLVLGIQSGLGGQVRVIRSAVITVKRNLYMEAAETIGVKPLRKIWRHVLPNIMAPVIVMFTVSMGTAIIAEATLSFLGLGVPPPEPSWGSMLSLSGRSYMLVAPWMAFWPGLCLCVAAYGMNILGDALRDLLDPRLRGGLGSFEQRKSAVKKLLSLIPVKRDVQWSTKAKR